MVAQAVVFAALAVYDLSGAGNHSLGEDDLLAELDTAAFLKVGRILLAACRDALAQGKALKLNIRFVIGFLHIGASFHAVNGNRHMRNR